MTGVTEEPLGKYSIFVSADHTFGTDAVLLASFASERQAEYACDLGTGCGIIPLLMFKENAVGKVVGVEIQRDAAELAAENAKLNALDGVFEVVNRDLKDLKGVLPFGAFDLVTCNPPYKAAGAGMGNRNDAWRIARHEVLCEFPDVCAAAAKLLKFGGKLCVCHRPERMADVICEMRNAGLEPKRFREVIQRAGERPWLVLVEGRLGGKPGMTVLPPLYIEQGGVLTEEMQQIYGDYKQGRTSP